MTKSNGITTSTAALAIGNSNFMDHNASIPALAGRLATAAVMSSQGYIPYDRAHRHHDFAAVELNRFDENGDFGSYQRFLAHERMDNRAAAGFASLLVCGGPGAYTWRSRCSDLRPK